MIRIAEVPQEFLPKMPVQYPPHQGYNPMIEERAYSFFATQKNLESDYIYIPIQWTSWHVNPGGEYGQNTQPLIDYCNQLIEKYPNEKFFTVVQYDGGTLIPIDNCTIFASSGDFIGYAGRDTHPLRVRMNELLSHLPQYKFAVNLDHNQTEVFRDVLYNSVFALSPRGFGPASFRMYEAIQMQCVPIYISDEFWIPFTKYIEWDKMCLLIKQDEIETIPEKVDALLESGEYQNMIDYGQEMYEKHLTWDGCLNTIARIVC